LRDLRELQHEQLAARLEHAVHFRQRGVLVRHVAQAEATVTTSKLVVGKGSFSASQTVVGSTTPASSSRSRPVRSMASLMSVWTTCRWRRPSREGQREVAGAARRCRARAAGPHVRDQHGVRLPGAVQAQRHQVVHQVVARRDRIEDTAHALRLVALVDCLEAEVGGAHEWLPQA
jgi:hypothetical protein